MGELLNDLHDEDTSRSMCSATTRAWVRTATHRQSHARTDASYEPGVHRKRQYHHHSQTTAPTANGNAHITAINNADIPDNITVLSALKATELTLWGTVEEMR